MASGKTTGIYRHGAGWRAVVSQGYSRPPRLRHFPLETPVPVMQQWRLDVLAQTRIQRRQRATYGTFAADAKRYVAAVVAMPTYGERVREIQLWVQEFGTRPRDRITPADIRAVRDRWLTEPRPGNRPPLAASTVNHRLRALSNLWTVLDGRRAPNPVRDVPEAREPAPRARALDYATIEQIIAAMPDRGHTTKGQPRPAASQTKARIRVLAYTGWPAKTLAALTRDDVDLARGLVRLPPRHKGTGADGVVVTLTPHAQDALREFDRLHCWGSFSNSSLYASFQRAARRVGVSARPYDLRHSALSAIAAASKDERAVQTLAQHRDLRTTRRYTLGSVSQRVTDAVAAFGAALVRANGMRAPQQRADSEGKSQQAKVAATGGARGKNRKTGR